MIPEPEFIEAVHRLYYDHCFGRDGKLRSDPYSKCIHDFHQKIHCLRPSWRFELQNKPARYMAWEPTIALHKDSKPKEKNYVTMTKETEKNICGWLFVLICMIISGWCVNEFGLIHGLIVSVVVVIFSMAVIMIIEHIIKT